MKQLFLIMSLVMIPTQVFATDPVQFDYMMNCQGCHLPDGAGFPAHQVPAVSGNLGHFLRVDGGREFLVQVPGSAQSDLSDARLAAVLNWMLTSFSAAQLPSDWQPYDAQEVHHLRKSPLVTVAPTRSTLIARINSYLQELKAP